MTYLQNSINNLVNSLKTEKTPVEKQVDESNKIIHNSIKCCCRLKKTTFMNDLIINNNNKTLIEFLKQYKNSFLKNIKEQSNEDYKQLNCNLVLTGNCGSGKSFIINAFLNEMNDLKKQYIYIDYDGQGFKKEILKISNLKCFRLNCYDLIQQLRNQEYDNKELEYDYYNSDLLVIDEVGIQFATEAERQILYKIIDYRYNRFKPTFILSNYTLESIDKTKTSISYVLGQRIMSRLLLENTKKIQLQGNMR